MDLRWNDWNVEHIASHGVRPEEAEAAVRAAARPFPRRVGDDKWLVWDGAPAGDCCKWFCARPRRHRLRHPRPAPHRPGEAAVSPSAMTMKHKPYQEMTAQELAAATRDFDEPHVIDQSRPLTPEEQQQWQRVKRKKGRPRVGQGARRISVSLEVGLLRRATALARKRRISRSRLLAEALEAALAREP